MISTIANKIGDALLFGVGFWVAHFATHKSHDNSDFGDAMEETVPLVICVAALDALKAVGK